MMQQGHAINNMINSIFIRFLQDDIAAYFPANQDDLILYTPNNSLTFKIMENVRYKMGIIEES